MFLKNQWFRRIPYDEYSRIPINSSKQHSRMCSLSKQCAICDNERARLHKEKIKVTPFCRKCKKYCARNQFYYAKEYFNGWICKECVVSKEYDKIQNTIKVCLDMVLNDINLIQIIIDYTIYIYTQCMNKNCNQKFMILSIKKQIDDKGNKIACYVAKYMNPNETQKICGIPSRVFCSKCVDQKQFSWKVYSSYNYNYFRNKYAMMEDYKWYKKENDRYRYKIFNNLSMCKYGKCMNLDLFAYCGIHKCSICHTRTLSNNLRCERCKKLFCNDCGGLNKGKCEDCNVLNDQYYVEKDDELIVSNNLYYGHSNKYILNEGLMNNYDYKEFGEYQYSLRAKVKRSYSKKSKRNSCKNGKKIISYNKRQRDKRGNNKLYKRSKYKTDFNFQTSKYREYII